MAAFGSSASKNASGRKATAAASSLSAVRTAALVAAVSACEMTAERRKRIMAKHTRAKRGGIFRICKDHVSALYEQANNKMTLRCVLFMNLAPVNKC